jgi:hypothetical protein
MYCYKMCDRVTVMVFYFMRISGCLYQNITKTSKSQKQLLNEK